MKAFKTIQQPFAHEKKTLHISIPYWADCLTFLPWQTGCVPLQVPLWRQVLSTEPIRLYPASQLKRSRLLVLNSSPPRRAPWGGNPGSPQIPGFMPTYVCVCVCIRDRVNTTKQITKAIKAYHSSWWELNGSTCTRNPNWVNTMNVKQGLHSANVH